MRRVILGVLGALLILGGAAAAFSGAVLVGAFGPDGRVDSPSIRLTSGSVALTSDVARLDADLPQGVELAQIHLSATSLNGKQVFIGVGPARQVLSYLAGSPYDVVTGVNGRADAVDLRRVSGTGTPPAPTSESFWVAQTFGGGRQSLDWSIRSGKYLFVIMNADGSAGIDVQARAGVSAGWVFGVGVGALAGGILLVIIGAVLLALGFRTPKRAVDVPVYAQAPPTGPGAVYGAAPPVAAVGSPLPVPGPGDGATAPGADDIVLPSVPAPVLPASTPQAPPREPGSSSTP